MIALLFIGAALAALAVACWPRLLEFLNGPVRDLLEKCFGAAKCEWYSNFLSWCDKKCAVPIRRTVKMQWKKFKDTVLRIKSVYRKNPGGSYTKQNETILRTGAETARRIVTEETIGYEDLPNEVREAMIKRRTKVGELDERALVAEKVRQRAEEDGIELTA